ncbi:MAG: endo,4-beta-xylanase [Solirubrobacteraceae bacterium]|nr:endo,4-beta-xylanase [Solirubrobacteraceae bacterium]
MGGWRSAGESGLLAAFAILAVLPVAQAKPPPALPLTPIGALRAVPQGTAVRLAALRNDARYRDTFLREFDSLTPENELKMQELQPRRGQFDFAAADELVRFARRNGKAVRGHTLVWGQALPLWLIDHGALDRIGLRLPPIRLPALPSPIGKILGQTTTLLTGWRRDDLLAVMKDHIRTVMRHYAGDITEWDVVNEPMAENGSLSGTVWRRFIGPDYIEEALRTARAADPHAKLFINDFDVEFPGPKLDGLVRLARDLVARGVPLDGIGLQTHTHIGGFPDEATLTDTMRRFTRLGLDVQVTEMDVATSLVEVARPERLQRQALAYGAAARACNAVKKCTRFTTWGFTDAVSWLSAGATGLLFDAAYRAKPAYAAVRSAFAARQPR